MPLPGRRLFTAIALGAAALGASLTGATSAQAYSRMMEAPKYAAIVVDANTGEVLYNHKAGDTRFPASITKVMTLYLTFEALATGRIHMDDPVPFSSWAASQAPSKLGVPAGDSITVRQAILGLTVKSANDAAVALAEKVGGTEAHFAQLMTLRAQELGMGSTRYVNANGLPDSRQVSSAKDIAILARAVMRDYPQYYGFFDQPSMTWQGHFVSNPHSFLKKIPNVDGLKTGFTNAAGHNLVASAMRGGRRLVTVVLGAGSSAARDENVAELMDAGFTVLDRRARGDQVNVASLMDAPNDAMAPLSRPLTEMGSAQDPQIAMVARAIPAAAPVRIALRPAAAPVRTAAVADDCRHERGRALRACRAAFHHAQREGTLVAVAADPCAGRHGRRARACRAEAA
ncbi:MAG: D-alanyl-D-alanine carboxypeptidase, partial [Caulobacteraceae bacterium]|nr:D-alanyl-D-alanine carboxypeptidase [Caulobacter sp.]